MQLASFRRDWSANPMREMLAGAVATFALIPEAVLIEVSQAHFWDITAVAALERVVERFKAHSIAVDVVGMNEASTTLIGSLSGSMTLKEV